MNCSAIILLAGNSTRYNKKTNKNLELLNGKPIISYSIEAFLKNKHIDEIILVCKKDEEDEIKKIITSNEKIKITYGGKERKDSVYNGLIKCTNDIVIIHDGARPLIKQQYIEQCLENIKNYDGCAIGVKAKDTIKIVDENNVVIKTTNRNNTYQSQTPQCFKKDILLELHKRNKNSNITDDCMLLEAAGYKVKIIDGDYTNIKITTPEDLYILQSFKDIDL